MEIVRGLKQRWFGRLRRSPGMCQRIGGVPAHRPIRVLQKRNQHRNGSFTYSRKRQHRAGDDGADLAAQDFSKAWRCGRCGWSNVCEAIACRGANIKILLVERGGEWPDGRRPELSECAT